MNFIIEQYHLLCFNRVFQFNPIQIYQPPRLLPSNFASRAQRFVVRCQDRICGENERPNIQETEIRRRALYSPPAQEKIIRVSCVRLSSLSCG